MTNKEAIVLLKPLFEQCKGSNGCLGYIEHYFSIDEETALDLAIKALEERPQGVWIGIDEFPHEDYECNYCGHSLFSVDISEYNFCPNCGASMTRCDKNE